MQASHLLDRLGAAPRHQRRPHQDASFGGGGGGWRLGGLEEGAGSASGSIAGAGLARGASCASSPLPLAAEPSACTFTGGPSLMLLGAPAGDKEVWMKRIKDWEKVDYHQPGDSIQPGWAWEGAESVAEVMAIMGWRISETDAMPSWLPTSRFGKLERGNTKELPEEK